jgi:hypothetical protein
MVPRAPTSRSMPRGGLNPPRPDSASRGVLRSATAHAGFPQGFHFTRSTGLSKRDGLVGSPRRPWPGQPTRPAEAIPLGVSPRPSFPTHPTHRRPVRFGGFSRRLRPTRLRVATPSLRPARPLGSPVFAGGKKPRRVGQNPTRRGRNREEADRPTIIAAPAAGKSPPPKSGPRPSRDPCSWAGSAPGRLRTSVYLGRNRPGHPCIWAGTAPDIRVSGQEPPRTSVYLGRNRPKSLSGNELRIPKSISARLRGRKDRAGDTRFWAGIAPGIRASGQEHTGFWAGTALSPWPAPDICVSGQEPPQIVLSEGIVNPEIRLPGGGRGDCAGDTCFRARISPSV